MQAPYPMQQVQIFILESATWHGSPVDQAILRFLERQGAAGATVLRGYAGFGAHRRMHTSTLVDVGPNLPLMIVWVDREDRVTRLLPQIEAMLTGGLVVSFAVTASHAPPQLLDHFPHDLQVRDVMTGDVLTVRPDASLADVADLFLHAGVRTIPVVNGAREVVGIITDGDLLRRAEVALPLSIREALRPTEIAVITPPNVRAEAVMTGEVVSVPEDLTIAAAIDVMAQRGYKRLPVLDQQGRIVGIVSRADILQTVAHVAPHAAPQHTPQGTVQRVADVMQTEVPTVRADTALAAVVEALAGVEQRRVVVVDVAGRAVGIITDGDLLRRASAEERPGIVRRMIDQLRRGPQRHERYLLVSGRTAADIMTAPIVTIAPDAPPAAAIRLMLEHHVKRLPVVDGHGTLIGLIGRAGVLRALSEAT